jgi:membrane protein DedA with SNARE-associated domain
MSRITQLHKPHFGRDILIIAAGISFAVYLAQHDLVSQFVVTGFVPLEAFVVGLFFTSLLTITPAGVAFAEMAHSIPLVQLALWGAAGAVVGDLMLFFFVRDALSEDILAMLRGPWARKMKALFKTPFLSWAVPLAGALVIASPLPDEVGLAMLGLSKSDLRFLIPISYAMNFLGIMLIGLAVSAG